MQKINHRFLFVERDGMIIEGESNILWDRKKFTHEMHSKNNFIKFF